MAKKREPRGKSGKESKRRPRKSRKVVEQEKKRHTPHDTRNPTGDHSGVTNHSVDTETRGMPTRF